MATPIPENAARFSLEEIAEATSGTLRHGATGVVVPAHGSARAGTFVLLTIACDAAGLRVDVHDGSGDLPVLDEAPPEAETGRGLLLVTSLSAEWGFYRTPAGKAVYFTLEFPCDRRPAADAEIGRGELVLLHRLNHLINPAPLFFANAQAAHQVGQAFVA